ncbi:hypothetical protein, partial [Bifidobacterium pseudolongum]|uniref:hypothetical protein n=1 Tax=Bifidobacterium pseudolongum TaxID=1694 RepID=UPI001A90D650
MNPAPVYAGFAVRASDWLNREARTCLCDTPGEALWLLGFVGCDTPVGCVGGGCGVGFSLAAARGLVRFFRVGVVG